MGVGEEVRGSMHVAESGKEVKKARKKRLVLVRETFRSGVEDGVYGEGNISAWEGYVGPGFLFGWCCFDGVKGWVGREPLVSLSDPLSPVVRSVP